MPLSEQQKAFIRRIYLNGLTYREIREKHGFCYDAISSAVKGLRSNRDAARLAVSKGRLVRSDRTKQKLSEAGKRAVRCGSKIWTKPERIFREILKEMGLGVRFPDYVKEAFGLADDEDPVVYFQYPLQRYVCDFVELERKIIYQVNGDFWHANPLLYEPEKLTKIQQHNLWHDKNRKRFLEAKGFRVVIAWESEIYWNTELVKNKIRAVRKAANPSRLHRENAGFDSQTAHYDWSQQLRELWFKKPRDRKTKDLTCRYCGVKFTVSARNKREIERKFCGKNCAIKHKTRNKPTAEKLKDLMKSNSWTALGRLYGVSDNAVRKWAKGYDLL